MPTRPRFWPPLFFSMIWCASRISVRSISDADMRRVFSRSPGIALTFALLINALAG